jgi:hypothetical protein
MMTVGGGVREVAELEDCTFVLIELEIQKSKWSAEEELYVWNNRIVVCKAELCLTSCIMRPTSSLQAFCKVRMVECAPSFSALMIEGENANAAQHVHGTSAGHIRRGRPYRNDLIDTSIHHLIGQYSNTANKPRRHFNTACATLTPKKQARIAVVGHELSGMLSEQVC